MTIAEAENFYMQDKKKYEVLKNKEFLMWYQEQIKAGYYSFMELEEIQELIDYLVMWYEMKYPEREFKFYDGVKNSNFDHIKPLSKNMDITQLMYRLSNKQFCLLNGYYRSCGYGSRTIYDDAGYVVDFDNYLSLIIERKYTEISFISKFYIEADYKTGQVYIKDDIKKFIKNKSVTLDELLEIFEQKYSDKMDFSELQRCVFNHQCDILFRKKILQMVALKLLYSEHTTPERGYERAKRFINEFNKKLKMDLNCDDINIIMSKDYTSKREILNNVISSKLKQSHEDDEVSNFSFKKIMSKLGFKEDWFVKKYNIFDFYVVKNNSLCNKEPYLICTYNKFLDVYVELFTKRKIEIDDNFTVEPLCEYYSLLERCNYQTDKPLMLSVSDLFDKYNKINQLSNSPLCKKISRKQ